MRKPMMTAALAAVLLATTCAAPGSASPDPVGSWGSDDPGEPNLVLKEGGKLSGTDGCNRLVGSWERAGDKLAFSPLGGTRMLCQDVDTWLSEATGATLGTDALEIHDSQDRRIGTLERAQ